MNIETFLKSLSVAATNPLAFVGYLAVIIAWTISYLNSRRLNVIKKSLEQLPKNKRFEALELEYRIVPKGGLTPEIYLKLAGRRYVFFAAVATLIVAIVFVTLASYKTLEEKKLSSAIESMGVALNVTKLGKISADESNFLKAAGNLEGAVEMYPSYTGYLNLGYVYDEISQTDSAAEAYKKALSYNPKSSEALNALGFIYKDKGDLDEAESYLKEALKNTTTENELWFMIMGNLGNVYYERARNEDDLQERKKLAMDSIDRYFLPALSKRGIVRNENLIAKMLAVLANAYKEIGEPNKAEENLKQAVEIKKKLFVNASLADSLNNLADLYLKKNEFAEAKPLLIEALGIFEVVGNELGIATIYLNLGDIAWWDGDVEQAKKFYTRSESAFLTSGIGGAYLSAPRKRLDRIARNDPPEFVKNKNKAEQEDGHGQ